MKNSWIICALILLLIIGCKIPEKDIKAPLEYMDVFVGIDPLAYFVERIGGEYVRVNILVQPGQSPHSFEITPKQMTALSRSKLFFTVGMPFEKQLLAKIRNIANLLTVVSTDRGIKKRMMSSQNGQQQSDLNHDNHSGEPDPHIWMSPPLIGLQAKNIAEALVESDPKHADYYNGNLVSFLSEIDSTDKRIRKTLKPYQGRSFYVFHPAFGYFGDEYGIKQEAVEMEGKPPTPKQLNALIRKAISENVKIIFVQPQFDKKSAETIADAIGGVVVPMNPLAKNVLQNLELMAEKIEKAFTSIDTSD